MSDLEDGEILAHDMHERPSSKRSKVVQELIHREDHKLALKEALSKLTSKPCSDFHTTSPGRDTKLLQNKKYYDIYGEKAKASVEIKATRPIRLCDVQGLVLWILAEHVCPSWVFVKNKPLVQRVVFILAHGLSSSLFLEKQALMPHLVALGPPAVVISLKADVTPNQTASTLLRVPETKKRTRQPDLLPMHPGLYAGAMASEQNASLEHVQSPYNSTATNGRTDTHQGASISGMKFSADGISYGIVGHNGVEQPDYSSKDLSIGHLGENPEGSRRKKGKGGGSGDTPGRVNTPLTYQGPFPPSHYIATLAQMQAGGYPTPTLGEDGMLVCPEGFVATLPSVLYRAQSAGHKSASVSETLVALDCEMCITAAGFELTRVTLVDGSGAVLMDELVLPHAPIVDYNTRFSGITAAMLEGCSMRLEHVQERFMRFVHAETLLVGHALENDLAALKIVHGRCIDTVFLFPHPKGPPARPALKVLAQKYLRRQIQAGAHDSIVDARTALDLVKLKFKNGPAYGLPDTMRGGIALPDVLARSRRRSVLVDRPETLARQLGSSMAGGVGVRDDNEAAAAVGRQAGASSGPDLVWSQWTELGSFWWHRSQQQRKDQVLAVNARSGLSSNGTTPAATSHLNAADPKGQGHITNIKDLGAAPMLCTNTSSRGVEHQDPSASVPVKDMHLDGSTGLERSFAHEVDTQRNSLQGDKGNNETADCVMSNDSIHLESNAAEASHRSLDKEEPCSISTHRDNEALQASRSGQTFSDHDLEQQIRKMDSRVRTVWEALQPGTLLIIASGQGDTPEVKRLQEQKYRRQSGLDGMPKWTQADEQVLMEVAEREARGLVFCAVKY